MRGPLWQAVLVALDGDHPEAERLVNTFKGNVDMLKIPWRNTAGTRTLLTAIRDGAFRPEGRPFVDLR